MRLIRWLDIRLGMGLIMPTVPIIGPMMLIVVIVVVMMLMPKPMSSISIPISKLRSIQRRSHVCRRHLSRIRQRNRKNNRRGRFRIS
jgi:hypothetical protein